MDMLPSPMSDVLLFGQLTALPPRDHLHGSGISVREMMLPPVQTLTQEPNSGKQICKCELTWSSNLGSAIGHCLDMLCVSPPAWDPGGGNPLISTIAEDSFVRVSQPRLCASTSSPSVSRRDTHVLAVLQPRTRCRGTQRQKYLRQVQRPCPLALESGFYKRNKTQSG